MKIKKKEGANLYILDTSALLCLWNNEDGAEIVERTLRRNDNTVLVSFMTFMEGLYRLWKSYGKKVAEEFYRDIELLSVKRIDVTDDLIKKASEIKATKRLSVADSWIIATAIVYQATLVHKDPEFEQVKSEVKLLNLPYKRS